MSRAEVIDILGGPSGDYTTHPVGFVIEPIGIWKPHSGLGVWKADTGRICVAFDDIDRAVWIQYSWPVGQSPRGGVEWIMWQTSEQW
jgi:hypothetical protein